MKSARSQLMSFDDARGLVEYMGDMKKSITDLRLRSYVQVAVHETHVAVQDTHAAVQETKAEVHETHGTVQET